ncbi:hypothetical protein ACYE2N_00460 [Flavobacterium sp. MAHUQ-51]|uniref:hypothetical protein n=1 Tax=Flavobacterium sp. GCM10022190 TaxID=3252639 RepID=UPI00361FF66A
MLKGISWNDYLIVVVVLTIIWYVFVGVCYYYAELKEFLSGKRKLKFRWLESKWNRDQEEYSNYQKDYKERHFHDDTDVVTDDIKELDVLGAKEQN